MRLIDADELRRIVESSPYLTKIGAEDIISYIDRAPTVDAKTILNHLYGKKDLGYGGAAFILDDIPEKDYKEP